MTVWEVPSPKTHNSLIYINSTDGQSKQVNIITTVVGVGRINLTVNDTSGNKIGNASVFIWSPASNYSGLIDEVREDIAWSRDWILPDGEVIDVGMDTHISYIIQHPAKFNLSLNEIKSLVEVHRDELISTWQKYFSR